MSGWRPSRHFTFGAELERQARERPDKVFIWYDDQPVTFAEADQRSISTANQLLSLGVRPGEVVSMFGLNSAEWVDVWFGAVRAGCVTAPVNPAYRGDFLANQLLDCKAVFVLADEALLPHLLSVADRLPDLRVIAVRGELPSPALTAPRLVSSTLLSEGPTDVVREGTAPTWDDPTCIFYTSGTTGTSKGAVMTQHYLCATADLLNQRYGTTSDDVMWAALPLFHMNGAQGVVLGSLMSGRSSALDSSFSPASCWSRVRHYQATQFFGVGAMVAMLWNLPPDPSDADLPFDLLISAPIDGDLHPLLEKRYGCRAVAAYGFSEAMLIASHLRDGSSTPGSAGTPSELYDVRIVDDDDEEVPAGTAGEIVVRPRHPHTTFEGYWHRPVETLAITTNLWLHTGDFGKLDHDGMLWFVDRKKDAIRRRGENISSFEVERAIGTHPAVLEVAAHAVPSELGEDDVKICVVLRAGVTASESDLMDHAVSNLPFFALPRYIEFMTELPKNQVGRLQKHLLRARAESPATWDRELAGYAVTRS